MMDGQNLFAQQEAPSWNVDRAMKKIMLDHHDQHAVQQAIIVGIEHGGTHRIDEYSAWVNSMHGGGEAPVFLDWLCHELKPFVDSNLRTLTGKGDTTIMGSSMGGLFAFFAIAERGDIFGQAGIFSPSLWFSNDITEYVKNKNKYFIFYYKRNKKK
jgi:predicted alpha/beta superfamily hydrolase